MVILLHSNSVLTSHLSGLSIIGAREQGVELSMLDAARSVTKDKVVKSRPSGGSGGGGAS